jgi:hypothetical protein
MNDETLIARLRYQGKQYEQGQMSRGGGYEPHILTQSADRIDELKTALNDLLNDCINFDDGNLTEILQQQACIALHISPTVKEALK